MNLNINVETGEVITFVVNYFNKLFNNITG